MLFSSLSSFARRHVAEGVLLLLLLCGALSVRFYRLHFPLADWHSFRQVDTAAVTREFQRRGIDLLHPRYHDVSNIQSGTENFDGWRMVEFPLLNALTAGLLQLFPSVELVVMSRLVSVISSMVSLLSLWWVARRLFGARVAWLSAFLFSFLPYNIFFSRAVLPEPFMVMWMMLATVTTLEWAISESQKKPVLNRLFWLLLSGVTIALGLLVKPTAVFLLPFVIGSAWRWRVWHWRPILSLITVWSAAVLPVWWWREWIQQYPTGIPVSLWLLNGDFIRLRPAWWRWLFADRLGREIFGYWGAPMIVLGVLAGIHELRVAKLPQTWLRRAQWVMVILDSWFQKEGAILAGIAGILAYVVIFATGNVRHDYYQVPLIPILSLVWARGAIWIIDQMPDIFRKLVATGAIATILLAILGFGWYEVKGFFNVNNWAIVAAGNAVKQHVPEDSLIIAPYMGDTTLLFATERWGWPLGFEIEDKRAKGAEFYISTAQDDETNMLMKQYTVIEKTPEYILIDLRTPASAAAELAPRKKE